MAVLEQFEPKSVFRFFEEISAIPRGTYDTKKISDYCVDFAKERGLTCIQDSVNNIIIKKPGTSGYEGSEPVILQGHLDMVCEKRPGSAHDFKTDGLQLFVEDGFVKAKDTTLGGDDGIAIAMALALLDSDDIPHPPIEAVFTVDEEIGMGGAMEIDLSLLDGHMLINIDSEEEGILTVGCAGGYRYETAVPVKHVDEEGSLYTIHIHGLLGGHSGTEIDKQRGNAHKLMGRLLGELMEQPKMYLQSVEGGTKDNVIAMDSTAKVLLPASADGEVSKLVTRMKATWDHEFMGEEPRLQVDLEVKGNVQAKVLDEDSTKRVIYWLLNAPNGVQEFSRKLEGLVETSLNVGIVTTEENDVKFVSLVRSSVESKKDQLKQQLNALAQLVGGTGTPFNEYPAWQFNPDSLLCKVMKETYANLYGKEPEISTIHAGLECGLFLGKRPDLDCVSVGPDVTDVHSFSEKLDIASTERTWEYLKNVLAALK